MNSDPDPKIEQGGDQQPPQAAAPGSRKRRRWWRVLLKTLMWILIVVLLIPVLIYIPPVQTLLKDAACSIVKSSTGLDISIEKFRLRFPLDVDLRNVVILEAAGDTMVNASNLIADVKLLPLLKLDVKVNKLELIRGYYRMVSPDSSMVLKIRAGRLTVDNQSSVDISRSEILLNKARLADGDVSLYMDVWKKKPSPPDTAATPFYIQVNDLKADNMTFAMSMLPTIDTLRLVARNLDLKGGVIDLGKNDISFRYAGVGNGSFKYLTPTPEFVKAHPVPVDTISGPSAPMTIRGDSISLYGFEALYAMKGATPQPGFDAGYIQATDVNIAMKDFFNRESTIRLPFTSIRARERCGLQITEGSGTVGVDSIGLTLSDFHVRTPYSVIDADADLPFAFMEMNPKAAMGAQAKASIAMQDITAFMPGLAEYTRLLPRGSALNLNLDATGSLADLTVSRLLVDVPRTLRLTAVGTAQNLLEPKRLGADLKFSGQLSNPSVADKFMAGSGVKVPSFSLDGRARIHDQNYFADVDLRTSAGDLAAKGSLALNAERYDVNADIRGLNVAAFMPDLGIGRVTATVRADGAGFNPTLPGARTDAKIYVSQLEYGGHCYQGISADAMLANHDFTLDLNSSDPLANLDLRAAGTLDDDYYAVDLDGNINHLDLQQMGFTPDRADGSGRITMRGTAQPGKWLYDVSLAVDNVVWNMGENQILLPEGLTASLLSTDSDVKLAIDSDLTSVNFYSDENLGTVVDDFSAVAEAVAQQIGEKRLDFAALHDKMPSFDLALAASGRGLMSRILSPDQLSVDTIYGNISNRDIFKGYFNVLDLRSGATRVDSIGLALNQRGQLLDYKAHMGNRPGTMDEFATVDVNGYIGSNRASLYLNQRNIKGETGYRLGLTGAMQDSTISVHFTPLKATIAYLPWTFNPDNYVDYNLNNRVEANLTARSSQSSIMLQTEPSDDETVLLHAKLDNIRVEDFLRMYHQAPPVTASVNADMRITYLGNAVTGKGTLGVQQLTYQKQRVGDFDFNFDAGLDFNGDTDARASLLVNGAEALTAHGKIISEPQEGEERNQFGVTLNRFPLSIANPFLGRDVAQLKGALNGEMAMHGDFAKPVLNGHIECDSVAVYLPIAGSSLRFDDEPLVVDNNVVKFNAFDIWAQNNNPLTINGVVDATKFSDVRFDINLDGTNVLLINNDKRARSDIYGKLYLTANAKVLGPMTRMDVDGRLSVLNSSDVTYQVSTAAQALAQINNGDDVVRFVQLSDSTAVAQADSITSPINMRINAGVSIVAGTQVTVLLSNNGTDRVELTPSGNLTYFQNYMGDMKLNGQLNLGSGYARYNIPVMGEKKFVFEPNSYVSWNGPVMNPQLHILAYDNVKAAVTQSSGNSQPINFKVSVAITNNLSAPNILFDLSTNDDISVANELQSMSPDQRSNQAMNMLITGAYMGESAGKVGINATGQLYSFLASQLNSWAAKNIRGVDLTFGIDQYDRTVNGQSSTATSYSYQVSKSLFNNKFKIVVGGNYSTDANADENFSQNLINDISFEYMLRQTNNLSMYLSLFRHTGFESILEGEVTETGVGFVMRRRISNFRQLFRFGRRNRNSAPKAVKDSAANDSVREGRPTP